MQTSRRNLILAAAGLPFIASCANDIIKLRELPVGTLANDLDVCAATYVVLRGGKPTNARSVSGCADHDAKPTDMFQAASLTKPVVAFAALRLVLDGHLDLNAPVSRYLPNGYKHFHSLLNRSADDAHDLVPASLLGRITIAQLLNHSSGLPNWSSGVLSIDAEPGQRWGYSGEGFVLLQSVIEAVTNTEFSTYMQRQVFDPLGMTDSSLVWQDAFTGRVVPGITSLGFQQKAHFSKPVAAASMYTTAADYARFMAAVLADDALLSLIISKPVEADGPLDLQWGLGWGIERAAGGPYIWQWGNNPGFRSFAIASISSKDGFVILTNSDRGMPLAASLARSALPADHNAFRFSWVA